jgi:creatinine amidohydrolase
MSTRHYELATMTLADVRDLSPGVAVLPFGATEPHNLHLPYATDNFEATTIGRHVCEAAIQKGAKVVLLPTIPYGTETNLQHFPLAINLNPSTLLAVMRDIVRSLENSGIHKLVLLNSHGGNDFKPMLRELYGTTPVRIFLCNWFQAIADVTRDLLKNPDDHAGEMETSFMLAYHPETVSRHLDGRLNADEGTKKPTRFEAINRGWVSITRPWHLLTTQSGAGNPHFATAEKGHAIMQAVVDRVAPFLVELSSSPINESFPF